jgi:hypothetical protein
MNVAPEKAANPTSSRTTDPMLLKNARKVVNNDMSRVQNHNTAGMHDSKPPQGSRLKPTSSEMFVHKPDLAKPHLTEAKCRRTLSSFARIPPRSDGILRFWKIRFAPESQLPACWRRAYLMHTPKVKPTDTTWRRLESDGKALEDVILHLVPSVDDLPEDRRVEKMPMALLMLDLARYAFNAEGNLYPEVLMERLRNTIGFVTVMETVERLFKKDRILFTWEPDEYGQYQLHIWRIDC